MVVLGCLAVVVVMVMVANCKNLLSCNMKFQCRTVKIISAYNGNQWLVVVVLVKDNNGRWRVLWTQSCTINFHSPILKIFSGNGRVVVMIDSYSGL